MADDIQPYCMVDEYDLYFENLDDCCEQWSTNQTITLNLVYRSQAYWNSALTLQCYQSAGDPTTSYRQFHLECHRDGVQASGWYLHWCHPLWAPGATRDCTGCDTTPSIYEAWDLVSFNCDPFEAVFELTDWVNGQCCIPEDPPPPPPPTCDFLVTITEA